MPSETAAGVAWAKWGHVFAGALGVGAVLAWAPAMSPAQKVLALLSGMASAIWGTPIAVAVLRAQVNESLLSPEVLESIAGMSGFSLGMLGIFIVTGFLRLAESFSQNPWGFIDRLRGKKGEE